LSDMACAPAAMGAAAAMAMDAAPRMRVVLMFMTLLRGC